MKLSLHAFHAELPEIPDGDSVSIRVPVIPAPAGNGIVPTRSGPTHRVSDPRQLAAALNAQEVDARIDFDHRSEPSSPTFEKSTAADGGWVRDFTAAPDGAITAELQLSAEATTAVRERKYRYLSPGLWLSAADGEVLGMSSVALVNNPNMQLAALNNRGTMADKTDPTPEELQRREDALKQREDAHNTRVLNAAEAAVDKAVEDGRLAATQKAFALNAIKGHADGVEAGLKAFEEAYPAGAPKAGPSSLTRRVGPRGAPSTNAAAAPSFAAPGGYDVDDEQLQLHGQVADYARKRGISYREAVLEFGALQ